MFMPADFLRASVFGRALGFGDACTRYRLIMYSRGSGQEQVEGHKNGRYPFLRPAPVLSGFQT